MQPVELKRHNTDNRQLLNMKLLGEENVRNGQITISCREYTKWKFEHDVDLLKKLENKQVKRIKTLKLTDCGVNNEQLKLIGQRLPNLESVVLRSCNKITNTGLKHLQYFKNLKMVDVQRCKKIKERHCKDLRESLKDRDITVLSDFMSRLDDRLSRAKPGEIVKNLWLWATVAVCAALFLRVLAASMNGLDQ